MFKHMHDIDLMNYGMYYQATAIESDTINTTLKFELSIPSGAINTNETERNIDRFFLDLKMLNNLRGNNSASVQKAYEELLTLLALTNVAMTTEKDK